MKSLIIFLNPWFDLKGSAEVAKDQRCLRRTAEIQKFQMTPSNMIYTHQAHRECFRNLFQKFSCTQLVNLPSSWLHQWNQIEYAWIRGFLQSLNCGLSLVLLDPYLSSSAIPRLKLSSTILFLKVITDRSQFLQSIDC